MEVYQITEADQLNWLLNSTRKLSFAFAFRELSERQNKEWSERIRKSYFACGCNVGMHFMMASLLLILLMLAINLFFVHKAVPYSFYFYALLFIFLMAGAGKMIGKAIAHKQLLKDVKSLKVLLYSK